MDYDNRLTSTPGNLSSIYRSNFGYAPPPCPGSSLYNVRSGPIVNHPCFISPQVSSLPSFSPRRYTVDAMSSQNVRYNPYYPPLDPFMGESDYMRDTTSNLFVNDSLGGTEVKNKKWFHPQINFQQNLKMPSEKGKERLDVPTLVKQNPRRKKRSRNKNSIPKETFPAQNIYYNPQTNYCNANIVPNHTQRSFPLGKFSAQDIENYLQSNYYNPNIAANRTQSSLTLGKISAQDSDNNPQANYDSNAVLYKVPNEVMFKGNFPAQSIAYNPNIAANRAQSNLKLEKISAQDSDNNPQANYDSNAVLYKVPNEVMFKGNFPAQSIAYNPQTNYDPNYVLDNVQNEFVSEENFPSQGICSNPQTNYHPNMLLNQVPSNEVSASYKEAQECSSMGNEQNHTFEKNYSHVEVTEANNDNTCATVINSVVSEETNIITSTDKDTNLNIPLQNDLFLRVFEATVLSDTNVSDQQALNNIDLAGYELPHVTMPENGVFNIQDIRQENVENAHVSGYSFESIFEGKDYSRDDMVVLRILPNSSAQHGNENEDRADAFADDQISELQNRPVSLNNASDLPEASNKTVLKGQAQEVDNVIGENMVFSLTDDDYASEESVVTSKRKLIRTKKGNKSNNSRIGENATTAIGVASQSSTSSNIGSIFTNTSHHASPSYGRQKFRKQWMSPSWRRRHQRKYNESAKSIRRNFLNRFLRIVRTENEHMTVSENFWNSYRMLLNQIGISFMQTMHNILPVLIANSGSSVEKSNGAAPKTTKNLLLVKFPPKSKKQYNSGN